MANRFNILGPEKQTPLEKMCPRIMAIYLLTCFYIGESIGLLKKVFEYHSSNLWIKIEAANMRLNSRMGVFVRVTIE